MMKVHKVAVKHIMVVPPALWARLCLQNKQRLRLRLPLAKPLQV